MRRTIDVWYVCDEILCNFDCPYCTTQTPRRLGGRKVWANPDGARRYDTILRWLSGLPWRLRIRLQTLGEPFMSQAFLEGAAWLSRQENVDFVELVTNGSFTPRRFERFAARADIERISLWMTYHHTEIAPETLVENARRAQELGAFIVVHLLLFPDNLDTSRDLIARCERAGLRTDVTIGHNLNDAYPGQGLLPVLESDPQRLFEAYREHAAIEAMVLAHRGPGGLPCSAGHDYLRVFSDGEVYPCAPYRGRTEHRLGNALDEGFQPRLREEPYAPCQATGLCACKEDYFHLQAARAALTFARSLGYYEPADEALLSASLN